MASVNADLRKAAQEGKTIVVKVGRYAGEEVEYSPRRTNDRTPWHPKGSDGDIRFSGAECAVKEEPVDAPKATKSRKAPKTQEPPATPDSDAQEPTQAPENEPQDAPEEAPTVAQEGQAEPNTPEASQEPVAAPEAPQEPPAESLPETPPMPPKGSRPLLSRLLTERGVAHTLYTEEDNGVTVVRFVVNGVKYRPDYAIVKFLT